MNIKIRKYILPGCVIAGVMYCFNKFVEMSALAIDKIFDDELDIFSWTYGDIYHSKKGNGKPLLLIHDLIPGGSSYEWNKVVDRFAEDHTVYTIDLLGCGDSEKPEITYTNFIFVKLITDFVKEVIGEKTDVIATGYSSSIAAMAAHYDKDLFDRISFVNPVNLKYLSEEVTTKSRIIKKILEIPVLGTFIYNIITCKAEIQNSFYEKLYFNPFHVEIDVVDRYYRNAHEDQHGGKYLLASMINNFCGCNMNIAFQSIENQMQIISGEYELSATDVQEQYLNLKGDMEVASVSKTRHFPQLENAEEFVEIVNSFLK